jgi:hypothetical protein
MSEAQDQQVPDPQTPDQQAPQTPETSADFSSEQTPPTFEHIDDVTEAETPTSSTPAKVVVEPWSDEEIISGVAVSVVLGLAQQGQLRTPDEVEIFNTSFMKVAPAAIKTLKIGEALAVYGIGKNTGVGGLERLPPWVRLALGVVGIGVGVGMGLRAVQAQRGTGQVSGAAS